MPESAAAALPVLALDGLTVRRGDVRVLDAIALTIPAGPPYALVGESGSGKTTLLMAVMGLITPDAGEILVRGRALGPLGQRERASLAGMVFQDYQLFPHLTVLENCLLAPRLRGDPDVASRASALLGELGVAELAERRPHELSGGQRQRVAIARGLMLEPAVLFCDEPSAALDEHTTAELARLLRRLNAKSQIVVVSHDWPFIARCCERGALLDRGRVAAEGALEAIRSPPPRAVP